MLPCTALPHLAERGKRARSDGWGKKQNPKPSMAERLAEHRYQLKFHLGNSTTHTGTRVDGAAPPAPKGNYSFAHIMLICFEKVESNK